MPKRSSKEINETAFSIVQQATGQSPTPQTSKPEKNPAAVALGRLGGIKGGKARAQNLSKARLKQIAEGAAKARWNKNIAKGNDLT